MVWTRQYYRVRVYIRRWATVVAAVCTAHPLTEENAACRLRILPLIVVFLLLEERNTCIQIPQTTLARDCALYVAKGGAIIGVSGYRLDAPLPSDRANITKTVTLRSYGLGQGSRQQ